MLGALLAKSLVDLSFGGTFVWYLVKFVVSLALAIVAVMLGIKWRKSKNASAETETVSVEKEA
ncbi:MAG: hypothetical protein J1E62_00330 [Lachnospiraceae bacterium]|nr:hypothetical protein [Lachnospiraceae bacterium]